MADGVGLSSTISHDIVEQGTNSIGQFVDNFGLKMTTNSVQFMFKSNQNLTNYLSHKSRRPKSMEIKERILCTNLIPMCIENLVKCVVDLIGHWNSIRSKVVLLKTEIFAVLSLEA